ncbi:hypothetical protein FB390_4380 [Nocardia bhagyanarayanae]|uniref:Uncharacterized protein n=1 Tax=Nocardia bhagyanarayanae TaxID=1215925 RepID=A0A543FFN6_9NOCA|nr:hypothetical protein FB390_4380 [Nocardia bhagyanarayanae]
MDPCSVPAVLTAAVGAALEYQGGDPDQRAALRRARPLLTEEFAALADTAALVWLPVPVATWHRWQNKPPTTAVRVTADDHPPDTSTRAQRVLAVTVHPHDAPPLDLAVYAHVERDRAPSSAWRLSWLEVTP